MASRLAPASTVRDDVKPVAPSTASAWPARNPLPQYVTIGAPRSPPARASAVALREASSWRGRRVAQLAWPSAHSLAVRTSSTIGQRPPLAVHSSSLTTGTLLAGHSMMSARACRARNCQMSCEPHGIPGARRPADGQLWPPSQLCTRNNDTTRSSAESSRTTQTPLCDAPAAHQPCPEPRAVARAILGADAEQVAVLIPPRLAARPPELRHLRIRPRLRCAAVVLRKEPHQRVDGRVVPAVVALRHAVLVLRTLRPVVARARLAVVRVVCRDPRII